MPEICKHLRAFGIPGRMVPERVTLGSDRIGGPPSEIGVGQVAVATIEVWSHPFDVHPQLAVAHGLFVKFAPTPACCQASPVVTRRATAWTSMMIASSASAA